MSRMTRLWTLALAAGLLVGCADNPMDTDAGPGEERDAGPTVDRDGGPPGCPSGQHVCGGGCVDDLMNTPENGCRLGCGEACQVPTGGVATCSDEGLCELGCDPPFVLMDDTCVCEPRTCEDVGAECGAPDDGCGTPLDCGSCMGDAVCIMGACGCMPDDQEPNDSRSDITMNIADIPNEDWSMVFESWNLHEAGDVDWYSFAVDDSGALALQNPSIRVTVDMIPMGSNYDVAAYYVCTSGTDNSSCNSGAPDDSVGNGCFADAPGTTPDTAGIDADCSHLSTDDSGTLYVRVTADTWGGSCGSYRLTVDVTN